MMILLIINNAPFFNIIYFLIYNSIIKLLPIILINDFSLKIKDIIFLIYLYLIYLIYMILSNKNPFEYYKKLYFMFLYSKDIHNTYFKHLIYLY